MLRETCVRRTALLALLLALACPALGGAAMQPGERMEFTYGGSASDGLSEMAVSADGRIVMTGYTSSHDGTLATRTKTGRTGWALCVDARGEVLWSFCSRLGVHDDMCQPVFHEDGSVTLLLYAEMNGGQEFELIRLDREGEVIMRKTLMEAQGDDYITEAAWRTEQGYVLMLGSKLEGLEYRLYGFDGRQKVFEPSVLGIRAAAGGFAVQVGADDRQGWLCRMDEIGHTQRLSYVFDVREDGLLLGDVSQLIAMEDGGVVGGGFLVEEAEGRRLYRGRLTRWDADGHVLFDLVTDVGAIDGIARIPGGYAATALAELSGFSGEDAWNLVLFDEAGTMTRCVPLEEISSATGPNMPIVALPDGSVFILGDSPKEEEGWNAKAIRWAP